MSQYLGEIGPIYGRWHWPLKVMEEGDWFHVHHADRPPEEVRNYVGVRAAQLGMRFSVMGTDPEHPNCARVTKVSWKEAGVSLPLVEEVDFDRMMAILSKFYPSVNANPLPIWTAYEGETVRVAAEQRHRPAQSTYLAKIEPAWKSAVEMDEKGFTITRVPLQTTMESFTEQRLADIMA